MLKIGVVSLFPNYFQILRECGITKKAIDIGLLELETEDIKRHINSSHSADDKAYGGGSGMVLKYKPLILSLNNLRSRMLKNKEKVKIIYLSPQGNLLKQENLKELSTINTNMIFICGRYEAIDERFIDTHVDEIYSIGDYVLSGGEIAAMAVIDGITRLLPGLLNNYEDDKEESFTRRCRLGFPQYTRPKDIFGAGGVPQILLSGNHDRIKKWRKKQSLIKTCIYRPDLIKKQPLTEEEICLLNEIQVN